MVVVYFPILLNQILFKRMKNEVDKKLVKFILQMINIIHTLQKMIKYFQKIIQKDIFIRQSGYLNSDNLEKDSDLNNFYDLEEMLKFVSDSLEVFPLYKLGRSSG